MIRIVLLGRTGNNLFQYALGRVLAEKHGVPLALDASWFNREGWSQVECIRRLPGPSSAKAAVVRRCSLGARLLNKTTGRHYWEYLGVPVLRENKDDHSFHRSFLEAPADCVLFGYFQSPLYFSGHEEMIRRELDTSNIGLERGLEHLADRLRAPGSIAIHVRRGDYSGNPNLDLCGMAYYKEAMDRMRAWIPKPVFHVFSDDPAWATDRFQGTGAEIIVPAEKESAIATLHLMSLANHHIIANSSFSWWAAWLGKKPGQKVLMPGRWFSEIRSPVEEKAADGWEIVNV